MQLLMLGLWQAVAPVATAALCAIVYFWWINRSNDDDDDDDDGDGPGLLVEIVERLPLGFHNPKGSAAC
jgi:hypothetical protein